MDTKVFGDLNTIFWYLNISNIELASRVKLEVYQLIYNIIYTF